ncbi:hypothetical protein [Winogradskyella helgolandensis]|uniref:hypothetical protein n=1 Tax=Winogradskyella helgolandensis TaxID=2697010 RepID=UPI0015CAF2C1|nr:hypothetical protein [Winogradskyella helgolandensis]
MNENLKQLLISINSAIELERTYPLSHLIHKIPNNDLKSKLLKERLFFNYGNIINIINKYLYERVNAEEYYTDEDVKDFQFENIENTTIDIIKKEIGISKFHFKTDEFRNNANFRHWDNLNRVAVICNKELVQKIKLNPKLLLFLEVEKKYGKLGRYTRLTIYTQEEAERYYDDRVTDRSQLGEYNNWHSDAYENDDSNLWNTD